MPEKMKQELGILLDLINQAPIGMLSCDHKGQFVLMNAACTAMLYPICLEHEIELENMFELLGYMSTDMQRKVVDYSDEYGTICENEKLILSYSDGHTDVFNTTVKRLGPELYLFIFQDYTETFEIEEQLKDSIQEIALQSGRLEMSAGVLHDIGNVATAFGSEILRIQNTTLSTEHDELQKLIQLFKTKAEGIDQALGAGKSDALTGFLQVITQNLANKQQELQHAAKKLYSTTSHIQEILNIQRHYIMGRSDRKRAALRLNNLMDDALAIMNKSIQKRYIQVHCTYEKDLPTFIGDETKLIQVLINLLKNSIEAFDELSEPQNPQLNIHIWHEKEHQQIILQIQDNACGFAPEKAEELFKTGVTTKATGTGLGLRNVKEIIESHHGAIKLESQGPNLGAKATITLDLSPLKD